MQLAIPYIVGLLIGVPLGLLHRRFREQHFAARLGLGVLVGLGIAVTINASREVLEWSGVWAGPRSQWSTTSNSPSDTRESRPEPSAPRALPERSTWEQQQHYDDGVLKAKRTVTRDAQGKVVAHGAAATYYPNGQLKWTGHYELGSQTGPWKEFYPDGNREGEGTLSPDGDAEETHWHSNGNLRSQGGWRHGKKHGPWKTWHATGQQAGEYSFRDGQLHGSVREWHPNGQLKLEARYEAGIPVSPVQR